MTITLTPDLERLVKERVASGEFGSVEEVLAEALRQFNAKGKAEFDVGGRAKTNTQAAIERIRQLRKGVTLGPGVTIRQLIEEGRRY